MDVWFTKQAKSHTLQGCVSQRFTSFCTTYTHIHSHIWVAKGPKAWGYSYCTWEENIHQLRISRNPMKTVHVWQILSQNTAKLDLFRAEIFPRMYIYRCLFSCMKCIHLNSVRVSARAFSLAVRCRYSCVCACECVYMLCIQYERCENGILDLYCSANQTSMANECQNHISAEFRFFNAKYHLLSFLRN